jgi:carbamoyltransferase
MARHVHAETGKRDLCLAGGVALNCVGNGKLLREGPFEKIWIQPAAGDAGGALGAALLAWYQYLGNERTADGENDSQKGSYLGPEFGQDYIAAYLERAGIPARQLSEEEVPGVVADLINDQKVVGWYRGRMEFGPRALGNRSIIGDARSPEMQRIINLKIKFRESFRPFAPTVLAERVSDYFDIDRESPYMLLVARVAERVSRKMTPEEQKLTGMEKLAVVRSEVPAITHVDYSARLQSVNANDNPMYHRMISEFERRHGCPVIINTSFNVRGEPIVCSPENAFLCFMRTDMDYLMLGNFLLDKREQRPLEGDSDWREEFELD